MEEEARHLQLSAARGKLTSKTAVLGEMVPSTPQLPNHQYQLPLFAFVVTLESKKRQALLYMK